MTKTNAMRLLEKGRVPYEALAYDLGEEPFSGEATCRVLGLDPAENFKTLCARGERKGVAVFSIPVSGELDLKAAAKALGDKAVTLVPVKELLALVGYERGSVSPVGTKKRYPTFLDESALARDTIVISGGAKGRAMRVDPRALIAYLGAQTAKLTEKPSL